MATTEQFSLRWNNFHSNLTAGFHELLEAAEMVDVTLAVEGHFLQAHKVVLSICSPYFKQMFKVYPCKHPIVILNDVGHENMKDILQFMYMGEVSVLRDNLSSFLRAAEILQVKGLTGEDSQKDDHSLPKRPSEELRNSTDREIYNITESSKQSDVNTMTQLSAYAHTPPQTSPVPLTKRQLKPTNLSTNAIKRSKCAIKYDECVSEMSNRDVSKPNIDYNSCDYSEPQSQSVPIRSSCTPTNEELKDMSSKCAIIAPLCSERPWDARIDAGLTTMSSMSTSCSSGSMGSMDLGGSDQDSFSSDHKGQVACPYCCRKFVNRYNLKVHIRDKHESNPTDLDCTICGKTMRNQSCLRVHMYHHRKQQMEAAGIV